MHTMAPYHRGIGCPLDRDINLNTENMHNADTEIESIHEFDDAVALHKPEETGHLEGPEYNTHTQLATLTWELDGLHQ